LFGVLQRGSGVIRQQRADLQADVPIFASGSLEYR